MERPKIFNETINKKTASRNKNTIQYERGMLSPENRVFVESVVNDTKTNKYPNKYNSEIIKKEFIDFEKEYPGLTFKNTDLLYDRMMNDARNVFPRNSQLKNKVSTFYDEMIRVNLNNIYHYAPKFFTDNFVQRTCINNTAFESYQVYIYLLCFITWTDKHRDDPEVRDFDNIDMILNWIATRRDPSIEFIISGPTSNSDITNNDFRSHYKTLIDASNDMSNIIAYNQLSSTQTISSDVYSLLNFIQLMPNVYYKNPDEARKYNINIDSAQDVLVSIDNDNNLIFDCSYVNLGDVTEQNKLAKFENLETVITNNKVHSMINTKKLAELFHNYSRIKILELIITPDTYISSLDAFNKVFVVFKGVSCSERNIYNTISTKFLKVGGKFVKTNRGFEFKMDVDAITYKSVLADVKSFEVYLTIDPDHANQIIPNEYALSFSKHDVFQHPITTDVVYDSKVRGVRKILSVREQKTKGDVDVEDDSINSKANTINLLDLLTSSSPTSTSTQQQQQLIVNGKYSVLNDPKNRMPQHAKTNIPALDNYLFGDNQNHEHTKTFANMLYQLIKINDPTKKSSIIASLDKSINFARESELIIPNEYFKHYINRVIEILNDIKTSWTYDEKYDALELALTTSSKLNNEMKNDITKIINNNYFRYSDESDLYNITLGYPDWNKLVEISKLSYDSTNPNEIVSYYNDIVNVLSHDVSVEQHERSTINYKFENELVDEDCFNQIKSIVWDLMTKTGNVQTLQTAFNDNLALTDEQINYAINVILQHNHLSYDTYEFAQSSLLQYGYYVNTNTTNSTNNTNTNTSSSTLERVLADLRNHRPLSTDDKQIITNSINSFINYEPATYTSIYQHIQAKQQLTDDELTQLEIILNRSLLLTSSTVNSLMAIVEDPNMLKLYESLIQTVFTYDKRINALDHYSSIQEINQYNKPISSIQQRDELIKQVSQYVGKDKLIDDFNNDTYTQAETEQLLKMTKQYYATFEKEKDYNPVDFILFMKQIQLAKYYQLFDYESYTLTDTVILTELTQFFYNISNNVNGYINSNIDFITYYSNLLNDYNLIGSGYFTYCHNILTSLCHDTATTIKDLNMIFNNFKQVYYKLFNLLIPNVINDTETIEYTYRNVEVDTRTATIEGKYFRVDSSNFAYFDGVSTPDPNYLIYTEDENDLTLINLYTKYNEIIQPVIKGTFIYSESLNTIQNLSYPLDDYKGYQNAIRFDNNYNSNKGNTQSQTSDPNHLINTAKDENDMFYTYYSKSYGLMLSNMSESITTSLSSIKSITTSERWKQTDSGVKSEILITFSQSQYNEEAKTFTAECVLDRYDYLVDSESETGYSWTKSNVSVVANLTFVKIDDVDKELITNPDPVDLTPSNNGKILSMYYVFGTIKNIIKNADDDDMWGKLEKDELVCFITRLGDDQVISRPTDIIPVIQDRNNYWIVYNVLIEPSMNGEVGDFIIKDVINNQTLLTNYFNISFVNSLNFKTLDDIMANPDMSSPYTDLNNDVYAIQTSEQRDNYMYIINYVYNRNNSTFNIIINIEKEGVATQYQEIIAIHLSKKIVYRWSVNYLISIEENEQHETVITKTFTNQTIDLLRQSNVENPSVSYIDYYHFGIEEKYENLNNGNCNNYKAYAVGGLDVKKTYWNKSAFINSLMLCPVSTMFDDDLEPEYVELNQTIEYNAKTENVIVYNYENGFRRFDNRITISPNGITQYDENDNEINGVILNLFVNRNQKISCFSEFEDVLSDNYQTKTYFITNDDNKYYFQLTLTANEDIITNLTLMGVDELINNTNLNVITNQQSEEQQWVLIGSSSNAATSGEPVYMYYKDMGFEIIINYESQFSEFPTSKQITISSISVCYVKYSTIHFTVDRSRTENRVLYAPIETMRYSNVPANYCDESDILFAVLGEVNETFKLCPVFKYYEKCIVSPRYVDENGDYILLAKKYNQNVMAKPVYLRSQYNLNNPGENTIRDSPDVVYRIGDKLDPSKKHLLESVNKSMIMLGSVESDGTMSEIAIRANRIHAIPTASKLLMSVEFS